MAVTQIDAALVVKRWSEKVFREYVRDEPFSAYSGEAPDNVFQMVSYLKNKAGDTVTLPLITELPDTWIEGDDLLEGSEDELPNYADSVTVNQKRKAVIRGDHEQSKTLIEILKEGKYMLKKAAMVSMRNLKIARMLCCNNDGLAVYGSDTEGNKDTHLGNNTDRFLFGALKSNLDTTPDHSASLLTLDTTDDILERGIVSLAKRMAKTADPAITPISIEGSREIFVAFCGTDPMRDLRTDMDATHQAAAPRVIKSNPTFLDGALYYNDVAIVEVPEMTSIGTVGYSSAPVYNVPFCGAQAVWVAIAKPLHHIENNGKKGTDYGNRKGVGVAQTEAFKKVIFNDKQHGMVSLYVAAAADS